MPEDRSEGQFLKPEERLCDIRITLVRYSGVGMSYSPKSGVKRQMWFAGHVEHDVGDDRFKGKPVRIRLESPPDPEVLEKIKTEEEVDSGCGWFRVRANVEPRDFEKKFGIPPIEAFIIVSPETFDAVSVHAAETLDRLGRVMATINLVGKSLPKTGSGLGGEEPLPDLDVSEDKNYAVQGFEIAGTRTLYPRKVLPIERGLDDRRGARLSILLTDAAYELDVPTGRGYEAGCSGSVVNAIGKSYDGANVTVRIEEFQLLDPEDKLPERALFGYFSYWPKVLNKKYSSDAPFDFTLNHLPDDTRGLIVPVLSQVAGGRVILTVVLTNEEEELLGATDVVKGSVRTYSFRVRSRFANETS